MLLMPLTGNFTLAVERKVPVVASPSMKVICTVQNVLHLYFKIYFYYFPHLCIYLFDCLEIKYTFLGTFYSH